MVIARFWDVCFEKKLICPLDYPKSKILITLTNRFRVSNNLLLISCYLLLAIYYFFLLIRYNYIPISCFLVFNRYFYSLLFTLHSFLFSRYSWVFTRYSLLLVCLKRCSERCPEKVFINISRNSQENACVGVPF